MVPVTDIQHLVADDFRKGVDEARCTLRDSPDNTGVPPRQSEVVMSPNPPSSATTNLISNDTGHVVPAMSMVSHMPPEAHRSCTSSAIPLANLADRVTECQGQHLGGGIYSIGLSGTERPGQCPGDGHTE